MDIGKPLSDMDLRELAKRSISPSTALAAQIRVVSHIEGKEVVGGRNGGDYSGWLLPYFLPGNPAPITFRLRRFNPEIDARTKKPKGKYLSAAGDRSRLFIPPGITAEHLLNTAIPLLYVEGEFKALALNELAWKNRSSPRFIAIAIAGVWNWRGVIGKEENERGERVPVKGVLPDFDLLSHVSRPVIIAFDMDRGPRTEVRKARHAFSIEMRSRGASAGYLEWDPEEGKGPDDWLANRGGDYVLAALDKVEFNSTSGWEAKLLSTETGKPKALIENVRIALEGAPEFVGLAMDEFTGYISRPPTCPWPGRTNEWTDRDTLELCAWLQRKHIDLGKETAFDGVMMVAERNSFHPVRNYLKGLEWDGEQRIDTWLTRYAGAPQTNYTMLVGRYWLISAVARIYEPGCKADCALLLIGPEGKGKSSLCRTLGDPWFSDNLPDLSNMQDAAMHLRGFWIHELGELAALNKAALTTTKAYLSRAEDIYRPPYGRATVRQPRECVFIATSNDAEPLKDTSGNRRFWPVNTGEFDVEQLAVDRDQLWAEAVALYEDGSRWHISDSALRQQAESEQLERTEQHVWYDPIAAYCQYKEQVTVVDILREAIKKDISHQTQIDKNAVSRCLHLMGWKLGRGRALSDGKRPKIYRNPEYLTSDQDEEE